jgi:hypothetical protein
MSIRHLFLLAFSVLGASCISHVPAVAPPPVPTLNAATLRPPLEGCLAANEEAIHLRAGGKLRAARERLVVCTAETCPREVREECDRRLKLVEAATPTILFEARHMATGTDISGAVSVTMDGELLLERLVTAPVPVDPGDHQFVFRSEYVEGPTSLRLTLKEGEKDRRERIELGQGGCSRAPSSSGSTATILFGPVGLLLLRRRARPVRSD